MDNSRRVMNPDLYKEDGQIKYTKQQMKELGLKWVNSKRYDKGKNERKEIYRKNSELRKLNNYTTVKHQIVNLGDEFHTEFNAFKAWGMKGCRMAEKTKEKYLTNNRKDYTRQIHDRAPRNGRCQTKSNLPTKETFLWKNKWIFLYNI
jgi:outer membrane receptor for monomeric catechols